jgi:hypothetical protein
MTAIPITPTSKIEITKEWCLRMAQFETNTEIGAGLLAFDPLFDGENGVDVLGDYGYIRDGLLAKEDNKVNQND